MKKKRNRLPFEGYLQLGPGKQLVIRIMVCFVSEFLAVLYWCHSLPLKYFSHSLRHPNILYITGKVFLRKDKFCCKFHEIYDHFTENKNLKMEKIPSSMIPP
jgi:hypothetical protein